MSPSLAELADSSVVYAAADRACIVATGADAATWLNGVLTCDVALAAKGATPFACYGCALDVKGKLLADAIAIGTATRLEVFVPRTTAAKLLAMWEGYIVMEDCALAIDDARALVLVQGGRAVAHARAAGFEAVALDDLGQGGVAVSIDASACVSAVDAIATAGSRPIDATTAQRLHTRAGRATWGIDVDATNYVQEAALEGRAVSFSKGCYLGQEVVCMLQMRGKVHRKLARVTLDREVAAGAEVTVDGAVVGKITSIDASAERVVGLALVKTSAIVEGKALDAGGTAGVVIGAAG